MTKAETKAIVQANYRALESAIDKASGRRDLQRVLARLVDVALRQEREHRAFGARFTRGAARYKLPAKLAAEYFAVRAVAEDYRHLTAVSALSYLASCREDFQVGAMLGAALRVDQVEWSPTPDFARIDYAADFADTME